MRALFLGVRGNFPQIMRAHLSLINLPPPPTQTEDCAPFLTDSLAASTKMGKLEMGCMHTCSLYLGVHALHAYTHLLIGYTANNTSEPETLVQCWLNFAPPPATLA